MVTGVLQGWNTEMVFENFGVSGSHSFLTGAVYNHTIIQDNFYSLNEGRQGITATVINGYGALISSDTTGSGAAGR